MLRSRNRKASTVRVLRSRRPTCRRWSGSPRGRGRGAIARPANSIFLVTEGSGESLIGVRRSAWQQGDTFVAPRWTRIEHRTRRKVTLFTLTDQPLMRFCNYDRFEADCAVAIRIELVSKVHSDFAPRIT